MSFLVLFNEYIVCTVPHLTWIIRYTEINCIEPLTQLILFVLAFGFMCSVSIIKEPNVTAGICNWNVFLPHCSAQIANSLQSKNWKFKTWLIRWKWKPNRNFNPHHKYALISKHVLGFRKLLVDVSGSHFKLSTGLFDILLNKITFQTLTHHWWQIWIYKRFSRPTRTQFKLKWLLQIFHKIWIAYSFQGNLWDKKVTEWQKWDLD